MIVSINSLKSYELLWKFSNYIKIALKYIGTKHEFS